MTESALCREVGVFRLRPPDAPRRCQAAPTTERCYSCHPDNAAVDNTFVQFYPTPARGGQKAGNAQPGFAHPRRITSGGAPFLHVPSGGICMNAQLTDIQHGPAYRCGRHRPQAGAPNQAASRIKGCLQGDSTRGLPAGGHRGRLRLGPKGQTNDLQGSGASSLDLGKHWEQRGGDQRNPCVETRPSMPAPVPDTVRGTGGAGGTGKPGENSAFYYANGTLTAKPSAPSRPPARCDLCPTSTRKRDETVGSPRGGTAVVRRGVQPRRRHLYGPWAQGRWHHRRYCHRDGPIGSARGPKGDGRAREDRRAVRYNDRRQRRLHHQGARHRALPH